MYKELLKNNNLSITQKRIAILETLDSVCKPMTIEMIKNTITSDIDVSTIYRSLKTLVDAGIIYQTDFRDGASYFEFQKKHHHHITCTDCKATTSIDICVEKELVSITQKTGYTVTNHIFELFGLCKNCVK